MFAHVAEYKRLTGLIKHQWERDPSIGLTAIPEENVLSTELSQPTVSTEVVNNWYPGLQRELNDAVNNILGRIQRKLDLRGTTDPLFRGKFVLIGSAADGTKITAPDEFDFLFESSKITQDSYGTIDETDNCRYIISDRDSRRLHSGYLYRKFADALFDILEEIDFPQESILQHGGFASPLFSGTRFNGPAITLQFIYNGQHQEPLGIICVDITLSFRAPKVVERAVLRYTLDKVTDIVEPYFLTWLEFIGKVYLVPLDRASGDAWYTTTAHIDSNILHSLKRGSAVKSTIRVLKVLRSFVNSSINNSDIYLAKQTKRLLQILLSYDEHRHNRIEISKLMSEVHLFLPPSYGSRFNEYTKDPISVSSAAVKQCMLGSLLKPINDRFDAVGHIADVCEMMRNGDTYKTDHLFIPAYELQTFSVPLYAAKRERCVVEKAKVIWQNMCKKRK